MISGGNDRAGDDHTLHLYVLTFAQVLWYNVVETTVAVVLLVLVWVLLLVVVAVVLELVVARVLLLLLVVVPLLLVAALVPLVVLLLPLYGVQDTSDEGREDSVSHGTVCVT